MQNLSRWEHAVGAAPIDDELKMSLMFLRDRVVKGGPRTVDSGVGKVFHLYTDACYENGQGGLGGVLYNELGEMLSYFSAPVTKAQATQLNPLEKDTIIFELEALAALIGTTLLLHSAAVSLTDRVVVFLDNDGALGRIISGKSGLGLDGQKNSRNPGIGTISSLYCLVWKSSICSQHCRPAIQRAARKVRCDPSNWHRCRCYGGWNTNQKDNQSKLQMNAWPNDVPTWTTCPLLEVGEGERSPQRVKKTAACRSIWVCDSEGNKVLLP